MVIQPEHSVLKENVFYNKNTGDFYRLKNIMTKKAGDKMNIIHETGYERVHVLGKCYMAHKLAWYYVHGHYPQHPHEEIDHINRDKSDNRICNLRLVTKSQNHKNMPKSTKNTSGYNGVSYYKRAKKWESYIKNSGTKIRIGLFDKIEDAAEARKNANIKYGYHKNHGVIV